MTTEILTADKLATLRLEPGDTTGTSMPSELSSVPVVEATSEDNTIEYQRNLEANRTAHEAAAANSASMHRVYKSHMDTSYIFKDGSIAIFRGKRYLTDNTVEIAELDYEILKKKNPYLWIDPAEQEADPTLEDPMEKMKATLFAEWAANLERSLNPKQDAGTYSQGQMKPQSSSDVAETAAGGGPSKGISSQMLNLLARVKAARGPQ